MNMHTKTSGNRRQASRDTTPSLPNSPSRSVRNVQSPITIPLLTLPPTELPRHRQSSSRQSQTSNRLLPAPHRAFRRRNPLRRLHIPRKPGFILMLRTLANKSEQHQLTCTPTTNADFACTAVDAGATREFRALYGSGISPVYYDAVVLGVG